MQFHNKITTNTIGLGIKQLEAAIAGDQCVPVMRVAGKILSTKVKTGDLGPFTVLEGQIGAINLLTSEEHRSAICILPPIAMAAIAPMISNMGPGQVVEFALDITAEPNYSPKAAQKYKFGVTSLIEPTEKDPLSAMLNGLGDSAKPKKLAAPKTKK